MRAVPSPINTEENEKCEEFLWPRATNQHLPDNVAFFTTPDRN